MRAEVSSDFAESSFVPFRSLRSNVISVFFPSSCPCTHHKRRLRDGERLYGRIAQCTRRRPTAEKDGGDRETPPFGFSEKARSHFFFFRSRRPPGVAANAFSSRRLLLLLLTYASSRVFRERRVVCAVFVLCPARHTRGGDEILTLAPEKLLLVLYPSFSLLKLYTSVLGVCGPLW